MKLKYELYCIKLLTLTDILTFVYIVIGNKWISYCIKLLVSGIRQKGQSSFLRHYIVAMGVTKHFALKDV